MPGRFRPDGGAAGSTEYFPHLGALQGIAALMVGLYHVCTTAFNDPAGTTGLNDLIASAENPWWDLAFRIVGNGPGAVIIFFVLSGFVLALVLQKGGRSDWAAARDFLAGRMYRIYPAVISTLGIFGVVFLATGHSLIPADSNTVANYLLNMALIQPNVVGPTWSLTLEMLAAPLIFASWWAWRRYGLAGLVMPYVALVALSFSSTWNYLIGEPGSLGQIYAFLSGMLAYLYGRPIVATLPRPGACLLVAIACFAATRPIVGWGSYVTLWLETVFASAVVALLAFGFVQPRSWAYRMATYFGNISFSFYLLHPMTLMAQPLLTPSIADALRLGYDPLLIAAGLFVASVAFATPLAALQYALVERTFIAFRKAGTQSKPAGAGPAKADRANARASR